jgi:hypothetical protein
MQPSQAGAGAVVVAAPAITSIAEKLAGLAGKVAPAIYTAVEAVGAYAAVVGLAVAAYAPATGTGDTLSAIQKSSLPRAPNGDYLPDAAARGAHSTLGTRVGSDGKPYRQGATFDEKGQFQGRTDVTDHGRPNDHPNPHFHPAKSPNSVGSAEPVHP